jgi:hypothetical protein
VDAIGNTPVLPIGVVNYLFSALQSDLDFQPAPNMLPITFGDSYLLNGDSGGPAFQMNGDQTAWMMVGIHSASQTQNNAITDAGYARVAEGSGQFDVNVWQYRTWINDACMMVPEPQAWLLIGIGVPLGALFAGRKTWAQRLAIAKTSRAVGVAVACAAVAMWTSEASAGAIVAPLPTVANGQIVGPGLGFGNTVNSDLTGTNNDNKAAKGNSFVSMDLNFANLATIDVVFNVNNSGAFAVPADGNESTVRNPAGTPE